MAEPLCPVPNLIGWGYVWEFDPQALKAKPAHWGRLLDDPSQVIN